MSTRAPAAWAISTISATGLIVPSVFETWVNATSFGLQAQQHLEDVEAEDAVVRDRDELEVAVSLLDQDLPRDEVGVVLHLGQDDRVAPPDVAPAPRVGDEVDRLGRVAGEHDLVRIAGASMKRATCCPGVLVGRRRTLADLVDPAVDVGVVLAVERVHRLDDDLPASGSSRPSRDR